MSISDFPVPESEYQDKAFDAVLRRLWLEHVQWLSEQPECVRVMFENPTLLDDLNNAVGLIATAMAQTQDHEQIDDARKKSMVYGGLYGIFMAALRTLSIMNSDFDLDAARVVSVGRSVFTELGVQIMQPILVEDSNISLLEEILAAHGYEWEVISSGRKKNFTGIHVRRADGIEFTAKAGSWIKIDRYGVVSVLIGHPAEERSED